MAKAEKKQIKISYEQVSIQLDSKIIKKIDAKAKKLNLSRSQLLRNIIETGFGDLELLDKIGIFTAINFGKKVISQFKIGVASGKITINEKGEIEVKNKD
jgi:hypothetical protein